MKKTTPVEIGVDVTSKGTHVVGMYVLPDAVRYVFYSQLHPAPQRTWVGLTDEDAQEVIEKSMQAITGGSNTFKISANSVWLAIVREVEAKLKEKNT